MGDGWEWEGDGRKEKGRGQAGRRGVLDRGEDDLIAKKYQWKRLRPISPREVLSCPAAVQAEQGSARRGKWGVSLRGGVQERTKKGTVLPKHLFCTNKHLLDDNF